MKRIHIIGHKNSGKTTLIVELVEELTRRGYRVGTIKHTHHDHELDTPGKDSHRHREAGAAAVGILTRHMNAIFWPHDHPQTENDKYDQLDLMMGSCDIVLVEGDSRSTAPKIEVFRVSDKKDNRKQPIAVNDPSIYAIITDDQPNVSQPVWKRSDLPSIVRRFETEFDLANSADPNGQ